MAAVEGKEGAAVEGKEGIGRASNRHFVVAD
jgi:hypothetical protein